MVWPTMYRKPILAAVFLLVLSTGLARAQFTGGLPGSGVQGDRGYVTLGGFQDYDQVRSPEQMQRDREIESRYREVVDNRIPDKKPSKDPWGNIRQAPAAAVPYDRHRPM